MREWRNKMIKYFYITTPRILLVVFELAALIYVALQVSTADKISLILTTSALVFICVVLANFTADLFLMPPKDLDLPTVEQNSNIFSLNNSLGEIVYDAEENELGICVGAYFTQEDIYFMVKDENGKKLYYANEVYFNEEENE